MLRLRAELTRDGFVSEACYRCTAFVMLAMEGALQRSLRPNQVMAAHAVLRGMLAEVPTGEGKTLATALAACVAALAGIPVHVVTSNDYLAARDAAGIQPLARRLGLKRDGHCRKDGAGRTPRGLRRTYHLLQRQRTGFSTTCATVNYRNQFSARPSQGSVASFAVCAWRSSTRQTACCLTKQQRPSSCLKREKIRRRRGYVPRPLRLASGMRAGFDFRIDSRSHGIEFTPTGLGLLANETGTNHPLWKIPRYREEMTEMALRALHVLQRDKDYLVRDGQISIIDGNSGRLAVGRAWSRGLHQMVELKERCKPTPATPGSGANHFSTFFCPLCPAWRHEWGHCLKHVMNCSRPTSCMSCGFRPDAPPASGFNLPYLPKMRRRAGKELSATSQQCTRRDAQCWSALIRSAKPTESVVF